MTTQPPSCLAPCACFTIERKPGEGYQVTSAEGASTEKYKKHALDLLNVLGQPDPRGPKEYFRLIEPPATPSGEYVHVHIKLVENGQVWYHQAWFQGVNAMVRSKGWKRLLLLLSVLFIFVSGAFTGIYADRALLSSRDQWAAPGSVANNSDLSKNTKPDPTAKGTPQDKQMDELKKLIEISKDVRSKLKDYLSQDGLSIDTSLPVTTVKRSVKLIDDRDDSEKKPLTKQTIQLDNKEVEKLLKLLDKLENIANMP